MEVLGLMRGRGGTLFRPESPWYSQKTGCSTREPSRLLLVVSLYSQPIPSKVGTSAPVFSPSCPRAQRKDQTNFAPPHCSLCFV